MPSSKPVAGVRIGLISDKFVVNPTTQEMENSKLDLVLAGTSDAILMIEVNIRFYHVCVLSIEMNFTVLNC